MNRLRYGQRFRSYARFFWGDLYLLYRTLTRGIPFHMIEIQNVKLTNVILLLAVVLLLPLAAKPAKANAPPPVGVTVEGKPLIMPVSPIIVEDRTMIGVRFVGEAVGGTVEWDQARRQATVTRGSNTVVVTLDRREALVNGNPVEMQVAARLIEERTMVPLRFIAEALGGTVEWDESTRTVNILRKPTVITGVTYHREIGKSVVRVALSEPLITVTPRVEDRKVTLDLYPAVVALAEPVPSIFDNLVHLVEMETDGRSVRFSALLWHTPAFRQTLSPDGTELILEFDHLVTGVQFQQNGRIPIVNIGATGWLDYSISQLQNPPRLVADIGGAALEGRVPPTIEVGHSLLTRIRSAQFSQDPDRYRVVLDMPVNQPYEVLSTDFGLQIQFIPRIQLIKTEQLAGRTRLTLAANLPVDAKVTALPDQKQITIEIPQGRSDLTESQLKLNDGQISSIKVTSGANPNSTLVTIGLPYYLGHTVVSKDGDRAVVLDLVNSPVVGKRIWIDAGHGRVVGGRDDPGAIGRVYGVVEKVINLQVSLELQKQLEAAGAIVLMTRTGDAGIDFRERPALVNSAQPPVDLLISVHHNSAANTAARGMETYYWTTNPRSKVAADLIHAALLKGVGFPDRRVRVEAFNVIRDTRAPSVLLELGYLSNAEEEKAIADKGYPSRAAAAIKNGLFDYFWQEFR